MHHRPAAIPYLAAFTIFAHAGAAVASPRIVASGEPLVLLTNEQRAELGIKFGPDTPVDFFQAKNGKYYINSAGALGPVRGQGHPAAFNLHTDPGLTRVLALDSDAPAGSPADVQTILTDHSAECGFGQARLATASPHGATCGQYFDRNYAGGGSYFRCPDNQTSVYFYHGENHTAPDGSWAHSGWYGIGVGAFDSAETTVTPARALKLSTGGSSGQIIGMNLATIWQNGPTGYVTAQTQPFIGAANVVSPPDGYIYVYHTDATMDPAYYPRACRPGCMSVSRAPVAAFCSAVKSESPVKWQNYYRGGWSEPAVAGEGAPLGFGSGGAFTPLIPDPLPGEIGGNVNYLPKLKLFVMVRQRAGGVTIRTSADGLAWSEPQSLVDAPDASTPNGDAETIMYPRINVAHKSNGAEAYVLTYSLVTRGHFWKWAELVRQGLVVK
jgi:hypothetical protein